MPSSKKIDLKMNFAAVVHLSEARTPFPPSHTVYVYTVYLFTQTRGEKGRVEPERRLDGQQFTKLCPKYHHDIGLYLQSINTCRKTPAQANIFR